MVTKEFSRVWKYRTRTAARRLRAGLKKEAARRERRAAKGGSRPARPVTECDVV